MLKTFESYNNYNDKLNHLYKSLKDYHESTGESYSRLLLGNYNSRGIVLHEEDIFLDLSIFNDGYRFSFNDYNELQLRGHVLKAGYIQELDDEEFNNIYDNCFIVLKFKDVKNIDDYNRLNLMTNSYDTTKPETFYKHYVNYFKNDPIYLALLDWTDDMINTLTEDEKNILKSSKGISKFNL